LEEYTYNFWGVELNYIGALALIVGLVCLWASIANKDWYWRFTPGSGRLLKKLIGQSGYRYFCIVVNFIIFCGGAIIMFSPLIMDV